MSPSHVYIIFMICKCHFFDYNKESEGVSEVYCYVLQAILGKCKLGFGTTDDPLIYALAGNKARTAQYLFEKGSKITEKVCNVSIYT